MNKNKINIILADDNQLFLDGLKLLLHREGKYHVLDTCCNGKELLENEYLGQADLLLVDMEMPVMHGIQAAKRINYLYPQLPMIAITMHQEDVYLEEIITAGFRGFVHKPVVSKALHETIDAVLNNKFDFPVELKERIRRKYSPQH